jgi:hypothetical protein
MDRYYDLASGMARTMRELFSNELGDSPTATAMTAWKSSSDELEDVQKRPHAGRQLEF